MFSTGCVCLFSLTFNTVLCVVLLLILDSRTRAELEKDTYTQEKHKLSFGLTKVKRNL